jgi:hypothetical protein
MELAAGITIGIEVLRNVRAAQIIVGPMITGMGELAAVANTVKVHTN